MGASARGGGWGPVSLSLHGGGGVGEGGLVTCQGTGCPTKTRTGPSRSTGGKELSQKELCESW